MIDCNCNANCVGYCESPAGLKEIIAKLEAELQQTKQAYKECMYDKSIGRCSELEDAYGIAQDFIAHLERRIAKAIEIASTMKSLDAHRRLMEVLEGD